ncbi:MAG TPA: oxygenase MpaB family protein [Dehalococcoidia bacterium]|nr:oxygenase MpaB family protein [Dehalococcoidia bacterium]
MGLSSEVIEAPSPSRPFFPDGAAIRRVHREGVVLLGGGRALLMQVAHPAVAKGVAEHSGFRQGKRARLMRTLRPTLAIVFGTETQAHEAARSINRVHAGVAGVGYRADDPELLFWVLATLIDTAMYMHSRFLRPLAEAEAEAYYEDMLAAGGLLGVRRDLSPPDLRGFREYMALASSRLEVTPEAREIARDLFSGRGLSGLGGWALRQMTVALLEPELRDAYGFAWSAGQERASRALVRLAGVVLRHAPRAARGVPWFLLPPRQVQPG